MFSILIKDVVSFGNHVTIIGEATSPFYIGLLSCETNKIKVIPVHTLGEESNAVFLEVVEGKIDKTAVGKTYTNMK